MKKKICYITTISLTIKAFFVPQLRHLAENGYEVSVICSPDEALQQKLGEKIRFIPVEIARGISPTTLISSILELKKVFVKEKFDIVQYSTPNAAFCAAIAAKMAGVKIRNYHLMGLRYLGAKGVLRGILKLLEKITCKFSTHIECITKSNLHLSIEEKLFAPQKATIVWNGSTGGVDIERFDFGKRQEWRKEIRQNLGYTDDDFVFGFVGRITKDKGIDEILQAFQNVKGESKLLLIGEKEGIATLNPDLWENAQNNEKIIIHNSVTDIERYYAAIDALLLPSYREGFGNVIIEAGAVGTPAIISNIPGPIDAVIPDETAKLVNVKNVASLQKTMEEFLENKNLAQDMSKSAYNFVLNNFDSEKLNEKILERKRMLLKDDNE